MIDDVCGSEPPAGPAEIAGGAAVSEVLPSEVVSAVGHKPIGRVFCAFPADDQDGFDSLDAFDGAEG